MRLVLAQARKQGSSALLTKMGNLGSPVHLRCLSRRWCWSGWAGVRKWLCAELPATHISKAECLFFTSFLPSNHCRGVISASALWWSDSCRDDSVVLAGLFCGAPSGRAAFALFFSTQNKHSPALNNICRSAEFGKLGLITRIRWQKEIFMCRVTCSVYSDDTL